MYLTKQWEKQTLQPCNRLHQICNRLEEMTSKLKIGGG